MNRILISIITLLCTLPYISHAAVTMNFSPVTGEFALDAVVPIEVIVRTGDSEVNAVGGKVLFDTTKLEVVRIDTSNSFLSSWTLEPTANNDTGTVVFEGLTSGNTPYKGERGKLMTLYVKGKLAEQTTLSFDSASAVRASDGTGNNILEELGRVTYRFVPSGGASEVDTEQQPSPTSAGEVLGVSTGTPAILSPSHPDQEKWYRENTVRFQLTPLPGVEKVALSFTKKENGKGTTVFPASTREREYKDVESGIWYLHYTQWIGESATTTHYRVHVDTTAPSDFLLKELERSGTDPKIRYEVVATDTYSGVSTLEYTFGDTPPVRVDLSAGNTFSVTAGSFGDFLIEATVYDRAGNAKEFSTKTLVDPLETPKLKPFSAEYNERIALPIAGTAIPDSTIRVELLRENGETFVESGTTDGGGNFSITTNHKLQPGRYSISAVAQDNRGALSKRSEKVDIMVASTFVGMLKRHPLIPIAAVVLVVLLVSTVFVIRKFKKHETNIPQQTDAAQTVRAVQSDSAKLLAKPQMHSEKVRAVKQPIRTATIIAPPSHTPEVHGHVISLH